MLKFEIKKKDADYIKIYKILPNIITLCSLGIGITSILYSMQGMWQTAIIMILIATVLDGIDGRIARILSTDSAFGAELDSLCDFVNFGIAPSILTYLWTLSSYDTKHSIFLWCIILLFAMCMAIRLARFNTTNINTNLSPCYKKFFMGVPAPCGGLLLLTPIIFNFEYNIVDLGFNLTYYICYILIISSLCVSRIPTFSLKNISIKSNYIKPMFLIFIAFIISLILFIWYVMLFLAFLYLVSIPITYYYSTKMFCNQDI